MPDRIDAMTRKGYEAGSAYDALCPMATGREAMLDCMEQAKALIASVTIIDDDTFFAYIHGFQEGWHEAAVQRLLREHRGTMEELAEQAVKIVLVVVGDADEARATVNAWMQQNGRL